MPFNVLSRPNNKISRKKRLKKMNHNLYFENCLVGWVSRKKWERLFKIVFRLTFTKYFLNAFVRTDINAIQSNLQCNIHKCRIFGCSIRWSDEEVMRVEFSTFLNIIYRMRSELSQSKNILLKYNGNSEIERKKRLH